MVYVLNHCIGRYFKNFHSFCIVIDIFFCQLQALAFTRDLKATLREAIKWWQDYRSGACNLEDYQEQDHRVRQKLDHQLRDHRLIDADHQRLLDGIGRQYHHGWVLLFLEHPEMQPTNNRAERGLKGAVIARKVSHCSRNQQGARTYEAMKNVTSTLALRGLHLANSPATIIKGQPIPQALTR